MVALSARALRLIDAAIDKRAPTAARDRWLAWRERYPGIRERHDGQRDIGEPAAIPEDVAEVVLAALAGWKQQLEGELRNCPDWDEYKIAELDNQISYVAAVSARVAGATEKRQRESWFQRLGHRAVF